MAEPTSLEVIDFIRAEERAEWAVAFAAAVKMDVQQIEGTRYKFRFSETHPDH